MFASEEAVVGELTLTGLEEAVLAPLSRRAAARGRSVDEAAAAILEAEIARLGAAPTMSWDPWLVVAEEARRQLPPRDVCMTDLIREGRDER